MYKKTEAYSESSQISKIELCVEKVKELIPLTILSKHSISDVYLGCE